LLLYQRILLEFSMKRENLLDLILKRVLTRHRILGLLCFMLSGPFVAISFWWYSIAVQPFAQLLTIGIGLGLGAAGTFLLISPDEE
jgi:hypothetical protein